MKREPINLEWCRSNLKTPVASFAEMERIVKANEQELRDLHVRFAGCPRVQKEAA